MTFALIRSKGPIQGDGKVLTTKQLRDAIPVGPLLAIQIDAALTGKIKCIDTLTGEEVGVATPLPINERLKLIDTLVGKRLPAAKTTDLDEGGAADLKDLSIDPEEVKRLPLSQLSRVIEAQFESSTGAHHVEDVGPRDTSSSADPAGGGLGQPAEGGRADPSAYPNGDGE